MTRRFLLTAALLPLALPVFADPHPLPFLANESLANTTALEMGVDGYKFASVPGWMKLPNNEKIGNTHGGIVVDKAGLIYITSDAKFSIMVYQPDGAYVRSFPEEFKGVHGMALRQEKGEEFIYAAHLSRGRVVKLRLDGTMVWEIGLPQESGKYENPGQYKPTGVAVGPNGHVYIVDGYGQNWVHQYDENQKYVRSFGGRGKEPGKFQTCHGIALDTRGDKPLLLVCDRENRRLQHFDLDGNFLAVIAENLRRPCSVSIHGQTVAVAELEARVAILNGKNELVTVLGDNPDKSQWAKNPVPPDQWKDGIFTAPHGCSFDAAGNLFVQDWNATGRITKLKKL